MGLRIAAYMGSLAIVAAPLLTSACTAEVSGPAPISRADSGGSSSGGSAAVEGGSNPQGCNADAALAKARIWRLTDAQYVNAVRQLFGVVTGPAITEAETGAAEYTNLSELSIVNEAAVSKYQTAARDVARQAVKSHYATFMACGDSEACAQQFVRNRVARAFGRRLDEAEVTGYLDLFKKGAQQSPQDGVRLMIEATLQSPSFLYRTELGAPTQGGPQGQVPLTPHEIATALAFSFTNSVPDDQLWQKADTGALADPEVLAAEVDRLLDLPATKATLSELGSYWLGVQKLRRAEKDTEKYPEFTPELKETLFESALLFVQDLLANGSVADVLSSKRMYLNEAMATLYGISGVTGTELRPVEVTLPERGHGILSQPGVLAGYSRPNKGDPIHRGLFSYYSLVCGGTIPGPPANALDIAASWPAGLSERRYSEMRADTSCGACHNRFDPLGLVTERYDTIGRYTEKDASGALIDQSSVFTGLGAELDGPVDGVDQFKAKLLATRRLSDCAVQNLAVYTLGRADVATDSSCAIRDLKDALASTGKFRDFYRALATSPAFLKRDSQ